MASNETINNTHSSEINLSDDQIRDEEDSQNDVDGSDKSETDENVLKRSKLSEPFKIL